MPAFYPPESVVNLSSPLPTTTAPTRYTGGNGGGSNQGKLIPTRRTNSCPVCGDTTGDCRTKDGLVLCAHVHGDDAPGWKWLGEAAINRWHKFVPTGDGLEWKPAIVSRKEAPAPKLPEWTRERWHQHQEAILGRALPLNPKDLGDIHRRFTRAGLEFTTEHQERLQPVSLSSGYLIPTVLPDGQLCRGQICHKRHGGKYTWQGTDDGIDGHLLGEMPLTLRMPSEPKDCPVERALVEGLGVKPYLAAELTGIPTIGAAGGQWASSPRLLLESLGTAKTVGICPDGGAIVNRNVLGAYWATEKFLEAHGVAVLYGWWGQETKAHPDIDERAGAIDWITPAEFWGKVAPAIHPTAQPARPLTFQERRHQELREAILNPWGDREVTVVTTRQEAMDFLAAHPLTLIDGQTAIGKSELMDAARRLGFTDEETFWAVPRRTLAESVAKGFGIPYRGCIHSIHQWEFPERYPLILDETEANLKELIRGGLCRENRAGRIVALAEAIRGAAVVWPASATARRCDLEYIEAIRGERFKILQLKLTDAHPKGPVELLIHGHGVKGSRAYAERLAIERITASTHVPVDSLAKAKEIQLHIEGRGILGSVLATSLTRDNEEVRRITSSGNPGQTLADVGNPTLIETLLQMGYSIKPPACYQNVVAICSGKVYSPSAVTQAVGRVRGEQPVTIVAPEFAAVPNPLTSGTPAPGHGKTKERRRAGWIAEVNGLDSGLRRSCAWEDFGFIQGSPEAEWLAADEEWQRLVFGNFAEALALYLERDGRAVTRTQITEPGEGLPSLMDQVNEWKARPIVEARLEDLPHPDAVELTARQEAAREAQSLRRYYGTAAAPLSWDQPLTLEMVLAEGFGKGRRALEESGRELYQFRAAADDARRREKLGTQGYIWDATCHELGQELGDSLGLPAVLAHCLTTEYSSHDPIIREFAERLHQHQHLIPFRVWRVKLPRRGPDDALYYQEVVKWLGMILKMRFHIGTVRTQRRVDGSRQAWYSVDAGDLARLQDAIARHHEEAINQGWELRHTPLVRVLLKVCDTLAEAPPPLPPLPPAPPDRGGFYSSPPPGLAA